MEILYSDKDYAVCIKPVGADAEHRMPELLREALGGDFFPVHRLDQNVGGVMVYARTKQAAAEFSRLIQEGKMVKAYVAQVHGQPPEKGDWEDLLFKDSKRNKVFVVDRPRSGVKKARLEFTRLTAGRPLWYTSGYTPAEAIRSGCNLPAGAFPWWVTGNTAPGTMPLPQCSTPAKSPSPTRATQKHIHLFLYGQMILPDNCALCTTIG